MRAESPASTLTPYIEVNVDGARSVVGPSTLTGSSGTYSLMPKFVPEWRQERGDRSAATIARAA